MILKVLIVYLKQVKLILSNLSLRLVVHFSLLLESQLLQQLNTHEQMSSKGHKRRENIIKSLF